MLWEHRVEIQKSLRIKAKKLFSLDEKIILYDLTNTYFEGKKQDIAKLNSADPKNAAAIASW